MKHFIVSDDKTIVRKVLKGFELTDQKDNKPTLVKLKFSMKSYEKLAENKTKKNYRKLHKTYFISYTVSEKMKTLQTL